MRYDLSALSARFVEVGPYYLTYAGLSRCVKEDLFGCGVSHNSSPIYHVLRLPWQPSGQAVLITLIQMTQEIYQTASDINFILGKFELAVCRPVTVTAVSRDHTVSLSWCMRHSHPNKGVQYDQASLKNKGGGGGEKTQAQFIKLYA